jgi:hypothetical protein
MARWEWTQTWAEEAMVVPKSTLMLEAMEAQLLNKTNFSNSIQECPTNISSNKTSSSSSHSSINSYNKTRTKRPSLLKQLLKTMGEVQTKLPSIFLVDNHWITVNTHTTFLVQSKLFQ